MRNAVPLGTVGSIDTTDLFGAIDLAARSRLVVAVSGGGDSLALLFLLKQYLDSQGLDTRPLAVTVDHRLRPEAADEAGQVEAIARSIGIEHRTLAWEAAKPGSGISAAAREARHALLARAAREAGADIVLTGHTIEDQAETVAMRQQRGPGRGAAGIAPATLFEGRCWFVRPLLRTRRAALRRYLSAVGRDWIDDPSNEDRRHERVRLRAALSADDVAALAARAAEAGALREALGQRAASLIDRMASMPAPGLLRLDPAFTSCRDEEAAAYALRILLAAAGGTEQLPDAERTWVLLDRMREGAARANLSRTVVDGRKAGIFLHRESRGLPRPRPFAPGPWDGRFRLEGSAPDATVAPATGDGDEGPEPVPASLVRAAHAARPALYHGGRLARLLDREGPAGARAVPVVAPWARYLPCFDLAPARSLAALLGAAEIPPSPLPEHNRRKA